MQASQETNATKQPTADWSALARDLKAWGRELGFADVAIARAEIGAAGQRLLDWLGRGRHGTMDYMAKHAPLRLAPGELVPGAVTVISVRLPYLPQGREPEQVLTDPELGYVSRYALGRDYHKVIRNRLQKLADRIRAQVGDFGYRVFSDSAPVMEVEFARQSGLGWRGKHTLLLTRQGSWHFLGEIYTDLPLPADAEVSDHCGACTRCIDICPTRAIVAPYQVDARRCISYLTIELDGPIPEDLRPLLGNRIYGCDDCQLCCPWNRFSQLGDPEFSPR
ncbi:MAG TPA: tRNA epoxyqueuosine(34) reductase QueG, partial [Azospira sp.]|nr:tRNA epoxyqueuosine(34) reductase QueG [Azospira sp.]